MKRYLIIILILMLNIFIVPNICFSKQRFRSFSVLTGGGTGALDKLHSDGTFGSETLTAPVDGDIAVGIVDGTLYVYSYDSSSTDAESEPEIITPDDLPASGRWVLSLIADESIQSYVDTQDALKLSIAALENPPTDGEDEKAADSNWSADEKDTVNLTVDSNPFYIIPPADKRRLTYNLSSTSANGYEIRITETNQFAEQVIKIKNVDDVDYYYINDTNANVENPGNQTIYLYPTNSVTYEYQNNANLMDAAASNVLAVSSISMGSRGHFSGADLGYNDDSSPHVLTDAECKGSILTNAGATGAKIYTFPTISFGMNGMFMIVAGQDVNLDPPSGAQFWLNGVQMDADENIVNTADTEGDVISFWSVETSDGTYELFFKSDNSNWVEASP